MSRARRGSRRYSASRREETAWILDICASSRRDRFEDELEDKLFTGYAKPHDAQWLVDAHWRSHSLATTAFAATFYYPGLSSGSWEDICAEAAQRLREGWRLVDDPAAPVGVKWVEP